MFQSKQSKIYRKNVDVLRFGCFVKTGSEEEKTHTRRK